MTSSFIIPYPMMVREVHAVIGKETRRQAMEEWGGKPDVLVACVGGGSNAMGLFHEFIEDPDVRLIGVEAAGFGLDSVSMLQPCLKGKSVFCMVLCAICYRMRRVKLLSHWKLLKRKLHLPSSLARNP
ncbi:Tryptophan synthase beta chain 2 [Nymphaea thermarum]|nr:Tryptophan synthase beta chain 2 [Nymphaea thermarum]